MYIYIYIYIYNIETVPLAAGVVCLCSYRVPNVFLSVTCSQCVPNVFSMCS